MRIGNKKKVNIQVFVLPIVSTTNVETAHEGVEDDPIETVGLVENVVIAECGSNNSEALGPLRGEDLGAVHRLADLTESHVVDVFHLGDLDEVGIAGQTDAGQVQGDSEELSKSRAATHLGISS